MRHTLRASLRLMSRRQRLIYALLVAARALTSILDVLGIALIGVITGVAAKSLDPSTSIQIAGFTLPPVTQETLVWLVIAVLVVFALKAVFAITLIRVMTVFLARVESANAARVASYFLAGNLSGLDRYSKGDIVWAAMGSVSIATSGILQTLATLIAEGTLLVLVAATFFIVDPAASLFVGLYFGVIIVLIQLIIGRALQRAGTDAAEGNSTGIVVLDDAIGAFREILVLGRQDYFVERFRHARQKMASSVGAIAFLGGMPRYVVETALMLGVVMFVGAQFLTGQLASGLVTIGVFLTGGVRIMASLLPTQNAIANLKTQAEQAKLAQEILAELPEPTSRHAATPDTEKVTQSERSSAIGVELDGVSFRYPQANTEALSNVTLEILPGQHVAIIGPSGAGKTTLVDLILGLLDPTSGQLRINGSEQRHGQLIADNLVSYVPQRPGLVSGSIAENVALGVAPDHIDEQRVWRALEQAHLAEFVRGLDDGIHASVGNQSAALSGGQIQRVGLARALYIDPKLIVLDEATSALDAGSEALVAESIRELGADVTVIVIAHRLSTVQHADRVFVVDGGQLVGSGTFAEVRASVPLISEYVDLMSFE